MHGRIQLHRKKYRPSERFMMKNVPTGKVLCLLLNLIIATHSMAQSGFDQNFPVTKIIGFDATQVMEMTYKCYKKDGYEKTTFDLVQTVPTEEAFKHSGSYYMGDLGEFIYLSTSWKLSDFKMNGESVLDRVIIDENGKAILDRFSVNRFFADRNSYCSHESTEQGPSAVAQRSRGWRQQGGA